MISAFALVQVAVEYGVLTSRNMTSFRNTLAGVETQTWAIGVGVELRRNAGTRGHTFTYRATAAQWHANRVARRPKAAKLDTNETLRQYVQER
jgi:hypothetical protein